MYKQASQLKLRFNTSRGLLSVEQLWDLSKTQLAAIVRNLKKELNKNTDDELSFLDDTATQVDKTAELSFNIVKDVYLTKKTEEEAAQLAATTKEHNEKILALIYQKQEKALGDKSVDELLSMLK